MGRRVRRKPGARYWVAVLTEPSAIVNPRQYQQLDVAATPTRHAALLVLLRRDPGKRMRDNTQATAGWASSTGAERERGLG
ncbi:hypothetical protein PpBr36_03064 [Pyricularia pennisetigena]|uniref:hypothetical protein n=1 Tax=Pyricularia pennisetigena TaxID=1578925 RepID=UPI001153889F|nr:hypothetical protein PpBr36_03064 [Pyricularia pennisetigena]TLS30985.1 hypothetical protein PpBr36_03064 [Pyricularia pennisetigena]